MISLASPIHGLYGVAERNSLRKQQRLRIMSDPSNGQPSPISSWPLPPMQYVNLYTDENLKRGRAPRPPPPMQDSYSMFGAIFRVDETIVRPLEDQRIKRVYPQNYDRKRELKKLNHSLLANFLDLLDILVRAPDSTERQEKVEDLRTLFINIHHLVNEFRPHQARETLRVTLEIQKKQRFELAERFHRHVEKVAETLQNQLASIFANSDDEASLAEVDVKDVPLSNVTVDVVASAARVDAITPLDKLMCDIIDLEQHRS